MAGATKTALHMRRISPMVIGSGAWASADAEAPHFRKLAFLDMDPALPGNLDDPYDLETVGIANNHMNGLAPKLITGAGSAVAGYMGHRLLSTRSMFPGPKLIPLVLGGLALATSAGAAATLVGKFIHGARADDVLRRADMGERLRKADNDVIRQTLGRASKDLRAAPGQAAMLGIATGANVLLNTSRGGGVGYGPLLRAALPATEVTRSLINRKHLPRITELSKRYPRR